MPQWSKVWGQNCSSSGACSQSCFNPLSPGASVNGNILDGFPLSIYTCGQAMHEFALALKAALPANNVIVKVNIASNYTLDIRIDAKKTATATIVFANNRCDFPVTGQYTQGASTGSASFSGLTELLNWLVSSIN